MADTGHPRHGPLASALGDEQKSARPIGTEGRSMYELCKQVSKFDAKIVHRGNCIIFQTAEVAAWSIHRQRRGD